VLLTSKNREEINTKYTNEKSYIDRTKENHDEYEDDEEVEREDLNYQ